MYNMGVPFDGAERDNICVEDVCGCVKAERNRSFRLRVVYLLLLCTPGWENASSG